LLLSLGLTNAENNVSGTTPKRNILISYPKLCHLFQPRFHSSLADILPINHA